MSYSVLFDAEWIKVIEYDDDVKLHFDFIGFKKTSKKAAIDLAVEKIKKHDNLFLSLSGGLDSEFAAKSLIERNVKFTPVLVDYKSNELELWYAKTWCRQHDITPIVYSISRDQVIKYIEETSEKHKNLPGNFPIYYLKTLPTIKEGTLITNCADPIKRDSIDSKSTNNDIFEYATYYFVIENNKSSINFLYQSRELFVNYLEEVSELSKWNSTQVALAKYYEIPARPKIDFLYNIMMYGKIAYDSYVKGCASVPDYIKKCHRFDYVDFINRCYNQEKFYVSLKKN